MPKTKTTDEQAIRRFIENVIAVKPWTGLADIANEELDLIIRGSIGQHPVGLPWETIAENGLNHPIRMAVLRLFMAQPDAELSPKRIADELDEALGNVSYHVRVLYEKDMLALARTVPRRGAVEHLYKLHRRWRPA